MLNRDEDAEDTQRQFLSRKMLQRNTRNDEWRAWYTNDPTTDYVTK